MKKSLTLAFTGLAAFAIAFAPTVPALAMCMPIWTPPGRIVEPEDNTQSLLLFEDGMQTLVVEPAFSGQPTEFGMVLPLPAQPQVEAANEDLFTQLEDLTNPEIFAMPFMAMAATTDEVSADTQEKVIVVETKEVADFTASVLYSTDLTALTDWLDDNDFSYQDTDFENMQYYLDYGNGAYYFVALKVNTENFEGEVNEEGMIDGKLRPVEFTFATDTPILPIRTMAGDMPQMTFTLFTLADDPVYIPGAETIYMQPVGFDQIQNYDSLLDYKAFDKWLLRQRIVFDPANIKTDLMLGQASNAAYQYRVTPGDAPVHLHTDQYDPNSGVVLQSVRNDVYFDQPQQNVIDNPIPVEPGGGIGGAAAPLVYNGNLLVRGSNGADVVALQAFLNTYGFDAGVEDGVFGQKTKTAVEKMQAAIGVKVDGIVGPNTINTANEFYKVTANPLLMQR